MRCRDWIEGPGAQKSEDEDDKEGIPTPSLMGALSVLQTHLSHFVPVLEPATCVPIYRNISQGVGKTIVDKIVMAGGAHRFDAGGSKRFKQDVLQGWLSVIQDVASATSRSSRAAGLGTGLGRRPDAPWRYLRGVADLLALPIEPVPEHETHTEADIAKLKWTLSKSIKAAFEHDENDDVHGWAALSRDFALPETLTAAIGREVLRRRIECRR